MVLNYSRLSYVVSYLHRCDFSSWFLICHGNCQFVLLLCTFGWMDGWMDYQDVDDNDDDQ